jgi:DNA-directed RNA polymerase beta subunit
MDIKTSQAIKWIAPVGTRVKSKDAVVTAYKAIRLDTVNQIMNEKLGSLVKDESGKDIADYTIETYLKIPNNIDDAIVSDVMIQENTDPDIPRTVKTPDFTFARSSRAVIDKYNQEKDRKIIFDKFPEYVAADTLDPISLETKSYNVVYTVRVRLIKYNRAQVAEKITSRYGGKGVVSKIVADEMMPIINGKRVEVILNPYSTINRSFCDIGKKSQ